MNVTRNRQRGFAIVSAIFLVLVFAVVGGYMLTLSGVEHSTVDRALLNARAYFAARAGMEWGIHQAVSHPTVGSGTCSPAASFTLTGGSFVAVNVSVECTQTSASGGARTYYIYYLKSTASYGTAGTSDYIERKLEASVCRSDNPTTEC
ncbi:MAG: pilus assembly protein MshP [Gammaproteobacteria bacterium]|nr:pilus assembly protein MshP [Gammaproteobacteria bacterium]